MTNQEIIDIGRHLLHPYTIPAECPYLSEDQRELSKLDVAGRSAWMAEWLMLANDIPENAAGRGAEPSTQYGKKHKGK